VRLSLFSAPVVLLLSLVGIGAALPPPTTTRSDVDDWLAAVRAHEPGQVDDPATIIGSWSRDRLWNRVLPGLKHAVDPSRLPAVLKRGAMMHADIAMIQVLTRVPYAPDWDPRFNSSTEETFRASYLAHLETGRKLLAWVEPDPQRDAVVRRWYRAVTAWLFEQGLLEAVIPHLARADDVFGDDADIEFDRGIVQETLAMPSTQQLIKGMRNPPIRVSTPGAHVSQAVRHFERALQIDPGYVEARVRLGRAQATLGRQSRAVEELERALASASDTTVRYYALLFLGRSREAMGEPEAALEAYRAAAGLYPSAQSPLLAISRLAEASNSRAAARAAVARLLNLPSDDRLRADPWWVYPEGVGRHSVDLLGELRARIGALPR